MIPFNPKIPATVLAYHGGRIIGNRYRTFDNLEEIKKYAKAEKWPQNKKPYKVAVLQGNNFTVELELT